MREVVVYTLCIHCGRVRDLHRSNNRLLLAKRGRAVHKKQRGRVGRERRNQRCFGRGTDLGRGLRVGIGWKDYDKITGHSRSEERSWRFSIQSSRLRACTILRRHRSCPGKRNLDSQRRSQGPLCLDRHMADGRNPLFEGNLFQLQVPSGG
jgi:hypothetical protein